VFIHDERMPKGFLTHLYPQEERTMATYTDFCKHYSLDPEAPDSRIQYCQYRDAYDLLIAVTGEQS
jgi:hypothetical protein